jgi:hypothetical protein
MTIKKNLGFGGQWVDGTPIGEHTDSEGDRVVIDVAFLEAVVANYDPSLHEAPVVIGHPKTDAPAYGHVAALRLNNGRLERQFSEVNIEFEKLVKSGAYKKRSDAFYLDPKIAPGGRVPYLRHVGFLGAQPPAIKGIEDIHFAGDGGKTVSAEVNTAISFSEGDTMTDDEKKALQEETRKGVLDYLKEKFGLGKDEKTQSAIFTEADARKLVDEAVKKVETTFTEKITTLETENKALRTAVDSQVGGSKRVELVSFCEKLEAAGRLPKSFRRMGGVEFLEALAGLPADKKVTTIEFVEEGTGENKKTVKKKKEISALEFAESFLSALPPYIQFGEQFRNLNPSGDGSDVVNPLRMDAMREEAGIAKKEK